MYDKDYFENGILTGKSCYENYRWIPELTIPLAMTIIDYLGIERHASILDFGCAKGYLVKAFRWLGRRAYGYDISEYALRNADTEVLYWLKPEHSEHRKFNYCIAKDVFEHIEVDHLAVILDRYINSKTLFAIIPLGEDNLYRAPANNQDSSHITCMPGEWWENFFHRCGWAVKSTQYRIDGIKDKYYERYPNSHGFFTITK